ncbi:MAG TPA: hypothetical protein VKQ27_03840 [Acetobacteraceae bacterium]|nr:hypothetical protein [Acetobacteraceae bacterium]
MILVVPAEAMHGSEQMRKIPKIADPLQIGARHYRGEAHPFRAGAEVLTSGVSYRVGDRRKILTLPVQTGNRCWDEQAAGDQLGCKGVGGGGAHVALARGIRASMIARRAGIASVDSISALVMRKPNESSTAKMISTVA